VDALGAAGYERAWHHLVLQTPRNLRTFGSRRIHHFDNVMNVEAEVHHRVHSIYERKDPALTGSQTLRVREWLETRSYEYQHQFGLSALRQAYSEFSQK
jgi:hypothetical protein